MNDTHKIESSHKIKKEASPVRIITLSGLMAAVLCVLAPFAIPVGPVPISLTTLILYISLYVLGRKKTLISYGIYLLLGLLGLPVFSGFSGGIGKLLGPTGGYLMGFIFLILITGTIIDRRPKWPVALGGMLLGAIACYAFGTSWLAHQTGMNFTAALFAGVIPFIPGDLFKIAMALFYGPKIRKRISEG